MRMKIGSLDRIIGERKEEIKELKEMKK